MAIGADADWYIRTDGNDLNGCIFERDSGGTNYADQAAAQASWTSSLSMAATTTLTDSGSNNLFTSAMVGNGIQVNGLFYIVQSYTDANNVVVDRADTFTNQSGKLGGAIHDQTDTFAILNNATVDHAKIVSGNRVYIRGTGSEWPTSDDYRIALDIPATVPVYHEIIGYNGRPRIYCTTGGFSQSTGYNRVRNIYFEARGTTNSEIMRTAFTAEFYNCCFNTNTYDLDAMEIRAGIKVYNCQFLGTHVNAMAIGTVSGSDQKLFHNCYFNIGKGVGNGMANYRWQFERCYIKLKNIANSYGMQSNADEGFVIRHCVFEAEGSAIEAAIYVAGNATIENNIFIGFLHAGQGAIRLVLATNERVRIAGNAHYNCTAFTWGSTYDEYEHDHEESNIALTAHPLRGIEEIIVDSTNQVEGVDAGGTYTLQDTQYDSANVYKRTSPSVLYMFRDDSGEIPTDGNFIIQATLGPAELDASEELWSSQSTSDPNSASSTWYPHHSVKDVIVTDGTPASNPSIAATYTKQSGTHNGSAWYSDGTNDLWWDDYNWMWIIANGSKPAEGVAMSWTDDDFYYAYYLNEGSGFYVNNGSEAWITEASPSVTITDATQEGTLSSVPGVYLLALNDTAGGGAACKALAKPDTLCSGQDDVAVREPLTLDIGAHQEVPSGSGGTVIISKRIRRG